MNNININKNINFIDNINNDKQKYEALCKFNNFSWYDVEDNTNYDNQALFIRNNLDKMTDEEIKIYFSKITTTQQARYHLLKCEFNNYLPPQLDSLTLDKFIPLATKCFDRYYRKVGGKFIDDTIWNIHTNKSKRYKLNENEIIFENTINVNDCKHPDTINFLSRMTIHLNNICQNINVKLKFIHLKRDSIVLLVYKCTLKI
jgi:hypothetical protein